VISPAGLARIKVFEGLRLTPYIDAVGVRTVGYGHARWTGGDITLDQAEALLVDDLRPCLGCIAARVRVPLTQPQIDALASFLFNVGLGGLIGSRVETELNAGSYGMAGDAMLEWCHGVVNGVRVVLPALLARRQAERAMFLSELPTEPGA
jgi:lysozyme